MFFRNPVKDIAGSYVDYYLRNLWSLFLSVEGNRQVLLVAGNDKVKDVAERVERFRLGKYREGGKRLFAELLHHTVGILDASVITGIGDETVNLVAVCLLNTNSFLKAVLL